MGQLVTVVQKSSVTPGVVRFETNRTLTGMDHEIYHSVEEVVADRPPDRLARKLFEHGGVASVSMNSNVVSVHLIEGGSSDGLKEVVEDLYTFYLPGVEVVVPDGAAAD